MEKVEYKTFNRCNECKGLNECNRPLQGYINGKRCKYNLRGWYNDKIILEKKYDTVECENKQEIINHINKHHSIYLYGTYGKGKSHFLKWVANKYNLQGKSVYYSLVAEINRKLRAEVQFTKSTGEIKRSEIKVMQDIQVLFLDDLGNEKMTEFIAEAMQIVIDYRYQHNKPTFVSSNYSIKELFELYAQSIGDIKAGQLVSRIKTFGAVEMKGKNWRRE